ncbi:MAG: caspase family protein, partial [Thermodesulfobacteriota bacterium]
TGSLLIYATAPGEAAEDGEGRNGLFTSMLLSHMLQPGLSVEELLKTVRIAVVEVSGGHQVPWESSSLMGNFCFVYK